MAITKFTEENSPQSGEALKQYLHEKLLNVSPLDDYFQVVKDLTQFELRYNLDSKDFYTRFQQGALGDDIDFMRWATKYEIHQQMKAEMEDLFRLLDQYPLPVTA
ncbi:MAG: hypothetical protein KDI79_06155 [Anaerolineae bacterium]|nr:hypothetical protein [Anaerolineae bacterium]